MVSQRQKSLLAKARSYMKNGKARKWPSALKKAAKSLGKAKCKNGYVPKGKRKSCVKKCKPGQYRSKVKPRRCYNIKKKKSSSSSSNLSPLQKKIFALARKYLDKGKSRKWSSAVKKAAKKIMKKQQSKSKSKPKSKKSKCKYGKNKAGLCKCKPGMKRRKRKPRRCVLKK